MQTVCEPAASDPVNVLVVDDLEDTLLTLQLLLERPGLRILTASSAAQAFRLLRQHEVALALLDVEMPHMNGFALADQMRCHEHSRHVPVIFLTGHDFDTGRVLSGYEVGAVDVLYKPVEPLVLVNKVGVFTELYRQRRELQERNAALERLLRRNEAMAHELREAHGKAVQEALTDPLTGVPNRRHILQLATQALEHSRDETGPTSVAILDLDHFKSINDQHGHPCGDAVLREFCRHCSEHLPAPDALGRLGGEEFLLLMPGTGMGDAQAMTEDLRRSLPPYRDVRYTFSAGLTVADADDSLPEVMKRADDACTGPSGSDGIARSSSAPDPCAPPGEGGASRSLQAASWSPDSACRVRDGTVASPKRGPRLSRAHTTDPNGAGTFDPLLRAAVLARVHGAGLGAGARRWLVDGGPWAHVGCRFIRRWYSA